MSEIYKPVDSTIILAKAEEIYQHTAKPANQEAPSDSTNTAAQHKEHVRNILEGHKMHMDMHYIMNKRR